jgi:hypothetical protein
MSPSIGQPARQRQGVVAAASGLFGAHQTAERPDRVRLQLQRTSEGVGCRVGVLQLELQFARLQQCDHMLRPHRTHLAVGGQRLQRLVGGLLGPAQQHHEVSIVLHRAVGLVGRRQRAFDLANAQQVLDQRGMRPRVVGVRCHRGL